MAKKDDINKLISKTALLLVKLEDRISRIALETAEVADALEERIDALWDVAAEHADRIAQLEVRIIDCKGQCGYHKDADDVRVNPPWMHTKGCVR